MSNQNNQNQENHQNASDHDFHNGATPNHNTNQVPTPDRKGFALAALILSIIALITFFTIFIPIIAGIIALVFGILGLKSSRRAMAITSICIAPIAMLISITLVIFVLSGTMNALRHQLDMPVSEQGEATRQRERVTEGFNEEASGDFVPLRLTDDTQAPENSQFYEFLDLSFWVHSSFSVGDETENSMQFFGDEVFITITVSIDSSVTIESLVEEIAFNAGYIDEYDSLEQSSLMIHGVQWDHETIGMKFGGRNFFQTILLSTTEYGVSYVVSFSGCSERMAELDHKRVDFISSLRLEANPLIYNPLFTYEVLTVYSDNWLHFFQEDAHEGTIQFARRFVIAKGGDNLTNDFFDNFGFRETDEHTWPLFVHRGNTYHIIGDSPMYAVVREDLLTGLVSTEFYHRAPHVQVVVPCDSVVKRTQHAVDLFSDMLPDFNTRPVTADGFHTEGSRDFPLALFDVSSYLVRDDGFSQVIWRITGDDDNHSMDYMVLVLIYDGDELAAAIFSDGVLRTDGF